MQTTTAKTAATRRRFGRMARLRPGTEAEYDRLHAAVWPEVLAAIAHAGISNYSIFRHEQLLFSYFELPETADLAEVTRILLAEPACQRWERLMQTLQQPPDDTAAAAWWTPMQVVFHLEGHV